MAAIPAVSVMPLNLERIFAAHHGLVFRTAWRITGNAADAEDAMQTVFMRLLRRNGGETIDNIETYLRRAAINAGLDLVRARQEARLEPLEQGDSSPDPAPRPDRHYAGAELRAGLRRALARLQPKAAEIFAL